MKKLAIALAAGAMLCVAAVPASAQGIYFGFDDVTSCEAGKLRHSVVLLGSSRAPRRGVWYRVAVATWWLSNHHQAV